MSRFGFLSLTQSLRSAAKVQNNSELAMQMNELIIPRACNSARFFSPAENPFLRLRQVTPISADHSDHKALEINISGAFKIICFNWMMKNNFHNNGFSQEECDARYEKRLVSITHKFREFLKDENVIAIAAQEFAIRHKDISTIIEAIKSFNIPGWHNPKLHISNFGVMTCFKDGPFKKAFHLDTHFSETLGTELSSRCQLFYANESYSFANVHVPFKNTAGQFANILHPLLKMNIGRLSNHLKIVDFVGDKNLKPKEQRKLARNICDELAAQIEAEPKQGKLFTVTSLLLPSIYGHQKIVDGKKTWVSVDSIHRFVLEPSNHYVYQETFDQDYQPKTAPSIVCAA